MIRRSVVLAGVLAIGLNGVRYPVEAQALIGGDWRAEVASAARAMVDAGVTPGVAFAVTAGDRLAFAGGAGAADLTSRRAATGDSPFYIASTTKSLTALAAALASHSGDIDLDAPMLRYLPGAQFAPGVDRESITVRDLITLTHGLAGDGPVVLRTAYTGEFTRDLLLDLLRYHAPTGEHGSFAYNNLGYNLLGMVLESVYDEPWQDIVQRMVVDPVGMRGTSAYLTRVDRDRIALPHSPTPDGWTVIEPGKDDANMHAAGGHFASARDLGRYLAAHGVGVVVLVNGGGPASVGADLLATHIYDLVLDRPGARESFPARLDSLVMQADAYRRDLAAQLASRATRLAPLPHPLETYAGTYDNPILGRMDWRVLAGGLEMRMGVVLSRAEIFDAAQNALRIVLGGSGQVAQFVFPEGGGQATGVRLGGQLFTRTLLRPGAVR